MRRWRPRSLRGKLLLFSAATSLALGLGIGLPCFPDRAVISGEITPPNGTVLAAKDKRAVGKVSDDAGEIRASVRKGKPIINFWALTGPGDLDGKPTISALRV